MRLNGSDPFVINEDHSRTDTLLNKDAFSIELPASHLPEYGLLSHLRETR